jgi:hypothetical protein
VKFKLVRIVTVLTLLDPLDKSIEVGWGLDLIRVH